MENLVVIKSKGSNLEYFAFKNNWGYYACTNGMVFEASNVEVLSYV